MSSAPYMQLYVADYMADTTHLTTEQHGAYLLLLMAMWRNGAVLPNDPKKLARIAGVSTRRWHMIWPDLEPFFTETEDGLTQSRLRQEYEKAVSKSEKRSAAGRRGGISKALKSKGRGLANATVLPKHSSDIRYQNNPQTPLKGAPHGQPDLIAEQIPPPQPKAPEYPEEFQRLWEAYPRRSGSNDKRKALKAWTARLRAGHSPGEILAGVERYARWCEATGKVGTEMVKQAATFLGPADPPHFAEAWDVPRAKDPTPDSAPAAEQPIWADALREATRRRDMKAANELERLLRASDFTAATARAREYFRERTAA